MNRTALRSTFCFLILLGAAATVRGEPPPPLAPAESFTVNLDRPYAKGDRQPFDLVVATVRTTTSAPEGAGDDDTTTHEETLAAHLVGDCEITEIDSAGHELENTITVREFTKTTDPAADEKSVLPAGAKIVARPGEDDETKFTVNGAAPDKDTLEVLRSILVMRPAQDTIDMSAVFAGDEPGKARFVGDGWPISAAAAVKTFQRHQKTKNADDAEGTVRLVDIETCNGQRCMRVEGDLKVQNIASPPATQPTTQKAEDFDFKPSNFEGHYVWFLPVDPKKNRQDYSGTGIWEHPWEGEHDGKKYHGNMTVRRELHFAVLPNEASTQPAAAPASTTNKSK